MFLYFVGLKRKKSRLNCLFLKYIGVISFLVLKTIQIDILYMFLCSLFQKLWWNKYYPGNMAAILDLVNFHRFKKKKMQSLFFITTMFQMGINKKITFNKHFARKYIRAYTIILNTHTPQEEKKRRH